MCNKSYRKLKDKISKLEHDLNTVIQHPDSFEAKLIIARRKFKREVEDNSLAGTYIMQTSPEFLDEFNKSIDEYLK